MNARWTTLITLALCAMTGVASADAPLTGAQIRVDDDHAWVLLLSPESLPEPSVRVSRGELRAWFHDVDHERITTPGDGLALRDVRVRAGANHTTLVHVRIGDRRELSEDDYSIVPFDGGTAIRFERSALPLLPTDEVVAAAEAAPAIEEAEITEGADLAADEEAVDDTADGTEEAAEVEEEGEAGAALFETDTNNALPGAMASASRSETPTGLLLLITLFLGVLLLSIKFIAGKKKTAAAVADISVVSSKRIGPRHQLIVVRALGEEHLLSVNAGQTQRLTSVSVGEGEEEPEITLSDLKRLGKEAVKKDDEPFFPRLPKKAPAPTGDERFGARLLDIATRRTDSAETGTTSGSAVAGLLELRRKLG